MKKTIIKLTEQDLHKLIKESVNKILKEKVLGQGESFTPYKKGEGDEMRQANLKRSPEERNPSYAKALKRNKSSMEEEALIEIGDTDAGQARLGALEQKRNMQARNAWQRGDTQQGNSYSQRANNVGNYAWQQRQNQRNGLPNQNDTNLANANQRGREAYHGYATNNMSQNQYRGVVNKGWREGWKQQ